MPKVSKSTRIKSRLKELKELYQDLPEEKMKIAKPLMENAAFLEIELENLQKVISENGTVEDYKNGENQYGKKIGSEVQSYNSLMKTYNAINRRLEEMLPPKKKQSKFEKFLNEDE